MVVSGLYKLSGHHHHYSIRPRIVISHALHQWVGGWLAVWLRPSHAGGAVLHIKWT